MYTQSVSIYKNPVNMLISGLLQDLLIETVYKDVMTCLSLWGLFIQLQMELRINETAI